MTLMKRVTGIGGVFFRAKDAPALREWYRRHLGINVEEWGGAAFRWSVTESLEGPGTTVWSIFENTSTYFAPSTAPFMINYRVADLSAVLDALRAEGCAVEEKVEETESGKVQLGHGPRRQPGRVVATAARTMSVRIGA